jgi:hypothetical protein
MTDPIVPDPNPTPPPMPPAAPAYAPTAYTPAGAGGPRTLSLVSFIVGLVAFVFGWTPFFGLIAGVVAVILGVMGARREPLAPKWMWIVGIIAGALALLTSVAFTILFFIGAAISNSTQY